MSIALLAEENEYAPLLLLFADITELSETDTSVIYVFSICDMD